MKAKMNTDRRINVFVVASVYDKVVAEAAADDLPASYWVQMLIKKHFDENADRDEQERYDADQLLKQPDGPKP